MLYFLLKILLLLLILGAIAFYYEFVFKVQKTLKFYEAQGVRIMPGAYRPFLGNLIELGAYAKAVDASDIALP